MPQTITMQRGSFTTLSSNGAQTLFTNSSSVIATRVIINSILITTSTSTGTRKETGNVGGELIVTPPSQGTYLVARSLAPSNAYYTQFVTQFNSSNTMNSILDGTTANQFVTNMNTPAFWGTGRNQSFDQKQAFNASAYFNRISAPPTGVGSLSYTIYCPQNFWIGPNDVVKFMPFTNGSASGSGKGQVNYTDTSTVAYNFVLINEV